MKAIALILCLVALAFGSTKPEDHWAILIAGTKDYWNYANQADICHAYQMLKWNGIPEDQIITFAYDDVAHDRHNPYPG